MASRCGHTFHRVVSFLNSAGYQRFVWAFRAAVAAALTIIFTSFFPDPGLQPFLILTTVCMVISPTFGATLSLSYSCIVGVAIASTLNFIVFKLIRPSPAVSPIAAALIIFFVSVWFAGSKLPPLAKKEGIGMNGLIALQFAVDQNSLSTTRFTFPYSVLMCTLVACAITIFALILPLPYPGLARRNLEANLKKGRKNVAARFKALLHVFCEHQIVDNKQTEGFVRAQLMKYASAPLPSEEQEADQMFGMNWELENSGPAQSSHLLSIAPWLVRISLLKKELSENIAASEKYIGELAWEPRPFGLLAQYKKELAELKELAHSTDGMEILINQSNFKKIKGELMREIEGPMHKIGELCEEALGNNRSHDDSCFDELSSALSEFHTRLNVGRRNADRHLHQVDINSAIRIFEGSVASNFFFLNMFSFIDTLNVKNDLEIELRPTFFRKYLLPIAHRLKRGAKSIVSSLAYSLKDWRSPRVRRSIKVGLAMCVAGIPGGLIWNEPFGFWAAVNVGLLAGSGVVQGGSILVSMQRLNGTTLGAIFGHFVVSSLFKYRVTGLGLLVAWCFFCGFIRSNAAFAYMAMVASFSAGVIVLHESAYDEDKEADVSFHRIKTAFIGVFIVLLFDTIFFPERAPIQVFDNAMKSLRKGQSAFGRIWHFFESTETELTEKERKKITSLLSEFNAALQEAIAQIPNAVSEPAFWGKPFDAKTFEELTTSLKRIHIWTTTLTILISHTKDFSPLFASRLFSKMRRPLKLLSNSIFQVFGCVVGLLATSYPNTHQAKLAFAKIAAESKVVSTGDDGAESEVELTENQLDQNTILSLHDSAFLVEAFSNELHEMRKIEKLVDVEFLTRLRKFIRSEGNDLLFSNQDLVVFHSIMFSMHALARELENSGSALSLHIQLDALSSAGSAGDQCAHAVGQTNKKFENKSK